MPKKKTIPAEESMQPETEAENFPQPMEVPMELPPGEPPQGVAAPDDTPAGEDDRYAMRTQGTTELSSYEFWKRCGEEPVADWFPFKPKQFEVLEIDDGLNPTYFYYVDGDFVSVCLFAGETAQKNVYKGSGDFQE